MTKRKNMDDLYGEVTEYPNDFMLPVRCTFAECNRVIGRYQTVVEAGRAEGKSITEILNALGLPICCSNSIKFHPLSLDTYVEMIPANMVVGRMSSQGVGLWSSKVPTPGVPRHPLCFSTSDMRFVGYRLPSGGVTTDIREADAAVGWDPTKVELARRLTPKHVEMLRDLQAQQA
jgi:DNA-directed RNA polymerase subunit N (RpoN/RPB10)